MKNVTHQAVMDRAGGKCEVCGRDAAGVVKADPSSKERRPGRNSLRASCMMTDCRAPRPVGPISLDLPEPNGRMAEVLIRVLLKLGPMPRCISFEQAVKLSQFPRENFVVGGMDQWPKIRDWLKGLGAIA